MIHILGISAYYHDSAAALIADGEVVAAAQEERFTRKKHDAAFPRNAVDYCLKEAGLNLADVQEIVFYDKPFVKFERLLETYLSYSPRGFRSFLQAMPVWLKEKLYLKSVLKSELSTFLEGDKKSLPKLMFNEHHLSHAASAFYPSPFERAAVLCLDGVGEWATTTAWLGDRENLELQWEINFPHSLGLLYSAFTYYCGFRVNSGEYKLMGLAPYGTPRYVDTITNNLIDIKDDGSFRLNMRYFNFATGLTMTNRHFDELFGGPVRKPESDLTQREMDIASSIQVVTETIVLRLARTLRRELQTEYLCLAGGVALNCVANGVLLRERVFRDIWIQPAAGDAGGALGAALTVWHAYHRKPRTPSVHDGMRGAYLGPSYSEAEVEAALTALSAVYTRIDDARLYDRVAEILAQGNVVGFFSGRMEFGPRSLGRRSILGDPRNERMQQVMNQKIKFRESFRPFAPAVLAEDVGDYFEHEGDSPYMLIVAPVKASRRIAMSDDEKALFGIEQLNIKRSDLPAITHVDYSARVQTVHERTNPEFHRLLTAFKARTGCSVLVNTSFNVRGEPIVMTPEDAYRCFMRTGMDYLVIENYLLAKDDQPDWEHDDAWREEFALD